MSGSSKEVKEFQFKLNRKLRVFPESQQLQLENPVKLVASASKYGLIFAGYPSGILCISSSSVLTNDPKKSQGAASYDYSRREVNFGTQPTHLDVNADNELLAVIVIIRDATILQIFSVQSFTSAEIVKKAEMRLGDGVKVSDLQWNPAVPNMIGAVLNNGSAVVFECGTAMQMNSIPPMAQATCLCWSPKGKQVVLGARNGSLTQYKPELKAVKTFPPPSADMFVVSVHWLSSFQFLAAYGKTANPSDRPIVMIVNVPKNQPPSFVTYDDVCYGFLSKRPEYYFIHQQTWNIVILASGDSMEMSVLGSEPDGVTWYYWKQDDATRAELPLTEVGSQDVHNVGITMDYSPTQPFPINDSITVGPVPLLISLSHSGVLCIFRVLNMFPGVPPVCAPPQPLADQSGVHLFTQPQPPQQPIQPPPVQVQQPEIAQQVQPVQPPPPPQPVQVEVSKPLVSMPSPQYMQSVQVPSSQPQPNSLQIKPLVAPTSVPEAPTYPLNASQFTTPIKPALVPTSSLTTPTFTTPVSDMLSANMPPSTMAGSFSLGTSMTTPAATPFTEQKVTPQLPETKSPTPAAITPTPSPAPVEPKEPEVPKVDDSVYTAAIHEELLAFQAKMSGVSKYVRSIDTKVAEEPVKGLVLNQRDQYQEFAVELVEATAAQSSEVNQLRSNLLDLITFFETIKTRHSILNNPRLREMREAGELDPISKQRLKNIESQLYYIQSQLQQAAAFVDNTRKKQNGQTGIPIPTMEMVHQTIKTITNIVNTYKFKLNDIESKLNDHVKKMHQRKKAFPQIETSKKTSEESQLSTLAQKLLQTKLSDDSGAVEVGAWHRLISLSKKGNKKKISEWESWVRRHKVIETRNTQLGSSVSPLQTTIISSPKEVSPVAVPKVSTSPKPVSQTRSISRNLFDTPKGELSMFSSPLAPSNNLKLSAVTSTPLPPKDKAFVQLPTVPPAGILKPVNIASSLPEQPKVPLFSVPSSFPEFKADKPSEPKPIEPLMKPNLFSSGTGSLATTSVNSPMLFTSTTSLGIQPSKPTFRGFGFLSTDPSKPASDAKVDNESKTAIDIMPSNKTLNKPTAPTFSIGAAVATTSSVSTGFNFSGFQIPKTSSAVPGGSASVNESSKSDTNTVMTSKPSSSFEPTFSFGGLSLATAAPVTTSSAPISAPPAAVSSSSTVSSAITPALSFGGLSTSSTGLFSQPSSSPSTVASAPTQTANPVFGSGNALSQTTSAGSIFGSAAMKFTSTSGTPLFGSTMPSTNLFAPSATTAPAITKAATVTTAASSFSFGNAANALSFGQSLPSTAPISQNAPVTSQTQPSIATSLSQTPQPPTSVTPSTTSSVSEQSTVSPVAVATVSVTQTASTSAPVVQPTPATSSTNSIFGGTTSSSSTPLFGSVSAPPATSLPVGNNLVFGQSLFGQQSTAPATTVTLTTTTSSSPLLPTPTSQTAQSDTLATAPASTASAFTQPPSAPASTTVPTTPIFGQPTSTTPATPLFGQAAANTTTPSLFGQVTTATTSAPASIFGQAAAATAPSASTSLFPSATTPSSASPFGQPVTTTSSSVFGQPPQAAAPAFGSPAPSFGGAPSFGTTSVFGTPTQTTPAFGNPPAQATSVFGTPFSFTSPTTTQSVFGSPSATTSSGIFGTPTSTPSVFGTQSTISSPAFGQTPPTPFGQTGQSSPFGAAPSNQANPFFSPPPSTFGQQPSAGNFGSSGGSMFGSGFSPQQGGTIFGGGGSFTGGAGQSSFGSTSFQQSKQAGGFGGAPVFGSGSSPAFGGAPAFGATPAFGSPNKVFGSPGTPAAGGFGSPPSNNVFESMANQNTMTFGNLAQNQQQQQPSVFGATQQNQPPSFGGNSFTAWR